MRLIPVASDAGIPIWSASNKMDLCRYRVWLSGTVQKTISDSMRKAKNQYEVGGVLVGHRLFHTFFVVGATVPCGDDVKSPVSYSWNGITETKKVDVLISSFGLKPIPIGTWHSHIKGTATFSGQDMESNKLFAERFGKTIAAIVIPNENTALKLFAVWFISSESKASGKCCKVYFDTKRMPIRYLLTRKK